jgi:hypothetical protein
MHEAYPHGRADFPCCSRVCLVFCLGPAGRSSRWLLWPLWVVVSRRIHKFWPCLQWLLIERIFESSSLRIGCAPQLQFRNRMEPCRLVAAISRRKSDQRRATAICSGICGQQNRQLLCPLGTDRRRAKSHGLPPAVHRKSWPQQLPAGPRGVACFPLQLRLCRLPRLSRLPLGMGR